MSFLFSTLKNHYKEYLYAIIIIIKQARLPFIFYILFLNFYASIFDFFFSYL